MSNGGLTPVILYDASNNLMAVQDGVAIPASTSGILNVGSDEADVARTALVESKASSQVTMDLATYAARFSPANAAFSASPVYTRNAYGHRATSATTAVELVEANTIVGMNFATAAATASFKVKSTSANDTSAGTGVRTVNIVWFGTDGLRYVSSATMNGTSDVTVDVSPSAIGVQEVYSTSCGTGLVAAGTITVKNTGNTTTMGQIATGATRTVSAATFCQAGKTLYLASYVIASRAVACQFRFNWTTWTISSGSTGFNLDFLIVRSGTAAFGEHQVRPELSIATPSGQVGKLTITIVPDSNTSSDHYAVLNTMEM